MLIYFLSTLCGMVEDSATMPSICESDFLPQRGVGWGGVGWGGGGGGGDCGGRNWTPAIHLTWRAFHRRGKSQETRKLAWITSTNSRT